MAKRKTATGPTVSPEVKKFRREIAKLAKRGPNAQDIMRHFAKVAKALSK